MNKLYKRTYLLVVILLLSSRFFSYGQEKATVYSFKKQKNGIQLNADGKKLSVQFIEPTVVRIRFVPEGDFKDNGTDVCIPRKDILVNFTVLQHNGSVILQSANLKLVISTITGSIQYFDHAGKLLLAENPEAPRVTEKVTLNKSVFNDAASKVEKTANGDQVSANITSKETIGTAWKARQQFTWQPGEALYGLGSHQEDYMNLRGTMQYLYEYNLKKSMPVLMSTKGYGMLFDAGSAMVFHDDAAGSFMDMLAVNQVDYYFMYGPEFDQVVHRFRDLTGKVELPPKYMFGYIQSKEKYNNQHDIDSVFNRFRSSHIPLDVIVQDWLYWTGNLWGYKKFDEKKYPDPARMIENIHKQNGHFMMSIWPQTASNEEKEMGDKGFVLGRKMYDAFNPAARQMYWDAYVNKNLFSKGVDAWWPDSDEPVEFDWNRGANNIANDPAARFEKNVKVMADLLGEQRVNTYSLHHTMGIYENQRKTNSQKRVVILTRASYPGQQRYAMVWNGDTKATWNDFKSWIPGGLNYMVTGSPYWTIDAGAFFVRSKAEWFSKGDFAKGPADTGYREFYVRNIQYAGWLPVLRSHGTDFAREPWQFGTAGEPYYDAIIKQINLRYRLLPYVYSIAAKVTNEDYTMTRSLLFDFRNDNKVYDIKDEFMFGNSFLICPVTSPMYFAPGNKPLQGVGKIRSVYLPSGVKWFDFWTGKVFNGGQMVLADAPIDHIPVFVKAGSIVPMGPVVEYSSEKQAAPWEIRVYSGSNGKFTVYEDEGDNYNYQKGKSASFNLLWNDKSHQFTIGERKGVFEGMVKKRLLKLVLVHEDSGTGVAESAGKEIGYTGQKIVVKL
ncbi:MAG: glycoside hydrolase family 31 protein [Mucilaginibacter sp.]